MEITETAQKVLEKRYFINGERTWEELSHRVSSFFAKDEREKHSFDEGLSNGDFIPNSPTLMNAGTDLSSFSACFVLPVEDNIESIFKYYGDAGLIGKSGGGVGANFSMLRPVSSSVGTTGGVASGPISFMKGQDALTDIIKQGGRRRGANMGILNVDHPDILPFIKAKEEPGVLENFNLSVRVSDEFMMNKDEGVWDAIVSSAWKSGEPGLLFGDRIEEGNLTPELGEMIATNPCGEQSLLPYESCSLIAVNLSNHFYDGEVDWGKLGDTVDTATLFMNRVLDKSIFPIPECQEAMERTRKIGVGLMGLHSLLIKLKIPYDSEEGRDMAANVMSFIADVADATSTRLGEEEGTVANLPRRNACLTTIAPTGTISLLADCSSGCEPYFAPIHTRDNLDTAFTMVCPELLDMARDLQVEEEGKEWVS